MKNVFLLCSLLIGLAHGALYAPCEELMVRKINHLDFVDEIQELKVLSREGVFKLKVRNRYYVYRIHIKNSNDVEFEHFASKFYAKTPKGKTPTVQLLNHEESQSVFKTIYNFDEVAKNIIDNNRLIDPMGQEHRISVVPFVKNNQSSYDLMKSEGVYNPLRIAVSNIVNLRLGPMGLRPSHIEHMKGEIQFGLKNSSPKQIREVLEELRVLAPSRFKNMDDNKIIDELLNYGYYLHDSDLKNINIKAFEKLPENIKQEIADNWLIYTVLGIEDFHVMNWVHLPHENEVIAIDLANKTRIFRESLDFSIEKFQEPFSLGELNEVTFDFLMKNVSPELKKYLKSLDKDEILKIADEADFLLNGESDGIIKRINTILK
jgi:hypothetical protein